MGQVRIIDPSSFAHGLSTAAAVSPDWEEDYTTYASSTEFRNDKNGWYNSYNNADQQHIDTSVTYDGHQTLRSEILRPTSGCFSSQYVNHTSSLSDLVSGTVTEFWVEEYVRFEDGFSPAQYNETAVEVDDASGFQDGEGLTFSGGASADLRIADTTNNVLITGSMAGGTPASGETVAGDTSGASAMVQSSDDGCGLGSPDFKFLLVLANQSGRWNVNGFQSSNRKWLVAAPHGCTSHQPTDQVTGLTSRNNTNGTPRVWDNASGWSAPDAQKALTIADGSWHRIRLYGKAPSSSCSKDGEIAFWVDDTLVLDSVDLETDAASMSEIQWRANMDEGGHRDLKHWSGRKRLWVNGNDPGWSRAA